MKRDLTPEEQVELHIEETMDDILSDISDSRRLKIYRSLQDGLKWRIADIEQDRLIRKRSKSITGASK